MATTVVRSPVRRNDDNGISPKSRTPVTVSAIETKKPLSDRTNEHVSLKRDDQRPQTLADISTLSLNTALSSTTTSDILTSTTTKTTAELTTPSSATSSPIKTHLRAQQAGEALPTISDPGNLITPKPKLTSPRFARVGMVGSEDRAVDTPELPKGWTNQHDRAICYLDYRGYELEDSITKLRNYFPELDGKLSTAMIDTRLRQLDQIVEITYWAEAMRHVEYVNREESPRGTRVALAYGEPVQQTVSVPNLRESMTAIHPTIKYKPARSIVQPRSPMSSQTLVAV